MRETFQLLLDRCEGVYESERRAISERFITFPLPSDSELIHFTDFKALLCRLYRHLEYEQEWIRDVMVKGHGSVWALVISTLKKDFGPRAEITTFELVQSGREGGLRQVISRFTDRLTDDLCEKHIATFVADYWHSTPLEDRRRDLQDYISRYRRMLPKEMLLFRGVRIQDRFIQILREHPRQVRQCRAALRG